jgi:hypothetical protein
MTQAVQFTQRIQVHSEGFEAISFRRNRYSCRSGCGRTGTLIFSIAEIPLTRGPQSHRPEAKGVRLIVVCETCGRRWVPSTGPALRALRQ